ncbi:Transcription initiation factor IIB [Quaeritorhiza haematococci]|nr:Transcription initiation factor IIB [Quaeritorhiza haematococci]
MADLERFWEAAFQAKEARDEVQQSTAPTAHSHTWVQVDGFMVCYGCGETASDSQPIDQGGEWRHVQNETNNWKGIRCEKRPEPSSSLTTAISGNTGLQRLHQWNSSDWLSKVGSDQQKEFQRLSNVPGIPPHVAETSWRLYMDLYQKMKNHNVGMKRCHMKQGLKIAVIYFACKVQHVAMEKRDISRLFGTPIRTITKGCNLIMDIMGEQYSKIPPTKPEDLVPRFLQLEPLKLYKATILSILGHIETSDLRDHHTPISIVSATVYLVCQQHKLKIDRSQIQKLSGCSRVTLSKLAKKIDAEVIMSAGTVSN